VISAAGQLWALHTHTHTLTHTRTYVYESQFLPSQFIICVENSHPVSGFGFLVFPPSSVPETLTGRSSECSK